MEEIVCQIYILHDTKKPDASAPGREAELEEQIVRLQYLVSYLLETNEGLRQQLTGWHQRRLGTPKGETACITP